MSVNDLSSMLNEAIARLLEAMTNVDPTSTEYVKMTDQLTKLYKAKDLQAAILIKNQELQNQREDTLESLKLKQIEILIRRDELDLKRRVSMDTWAVIAANLAGIVIIIGYERAGVITSKAIGFVRKLV